MRLRLNGRGTILAYLGLAETDRRGWRWVRHRYGPVLYALPSRRVWADSEALDAWDRRSPLTGAELVSLCARWDGPGLRMQGPRNRAVWQTMLATAKHPPYIPTRRY